MSQEIEYVGNAVPIEYICKRCGKSDAVARQQGCERGPCPMVPTIPQQWIKVEPQEPAGTMRVTLPAGTIVLMNAAPLRLYSACEVAAPIEHLEMARIV